MSVPRNSQQQTASAEKNDRGEALAFALEAAEERFNILYRESSDPVFLAALNGDILSVNRAFEEVTGCTSAELFMGDKGWNTFVHPDDQEYVQQGLSRCVAEDQRVLVEYRVKDRSDRYSWFELGLSVLHNESGEARGLVAVSRDIDRRKSMEDDLRQQASTLEERHRKAQALIGNLKNFFTRIHELPSSLEEYVSGVCDLVYASYKPTRAQIYLRPGGGLPPRAVVSGPAMPEDDGPPEPLPFCHRVMEHRLPVYLNNLHDDEAAARHAGLQQLNIKTYLGVPLMDSSGRVGGVLSILDHRMRAFDELDVEMLTIAGMHIGARLRSQEEDETRRELEDHLKRASKMEAVGMLAGGIAHDFNNILSGILGFSSYLISKSEPGSDLHRDLTTIEQSAMKAGELTHQLQSFTRHQHFEKERVEIHPLIRDVLGIVSRSLTKNVDIVTELSEKEAVVSGDPGQLNQVVMNLALNAFEAMARDGGRLTVRTLLRPLTDTEKESFPKLKGERYVCLEVIDTGRGMDQDTLDRIFDPFFTTKAERGGSGLGLSIAYGTVSNHGGCMTVSSRKGEGSRFTILLPEGIETQAPELEEPVGSLEGEETIMVVDDELLLRQMVTEVLLGSGYQVLACAGGEEALSTLKEKGDAVDLVLLDMIMPGMNGYETFHELRTIRPELPVLLSSGFSDSEKTEALIESGASGMLQKPYRSETLLTKVRKTLNARAGRSLTE